ncbi:MAG: ImmA/IrrE family metallo-endopeptidase [Deltaproteobacteria bacterium]|nr:ImmA/IrrE family metallo-endopeptidase [Deltaproteobacteria bacterium]
MNPAILVWARERIGFGIPDAAKGVTADPSKLLAWERGEEQPSLAQARKLAEKYSQPLGVLFLSDPPEEDPLPADYRASGVPLPPEVVVEIRRVEALREAAIELAGLIDESFEPFPLRLDARKVTPVKAAAALREFLAVDLDEQHRWRDPEVAFRKWRTAIEARRVLVVVLGKPFTRVMVSPAILSGFAIASQGIAPTIAVNGRDYTTRKIFTLLHELAHVAIGVSGISDLRYDLDTKPRANAESYCNAVAAEILVPADELTRRLEGKRRRAWPDAIVRELSRDFCVSREVIVRRLVDIGAAPSAFYERWRAEHPYQPPRPDVGDEGAGEKEGGPSYYTMALQRYGTPYLKLVYEALDNELITLSDVRGYVGGQAKSAKGLRERLYQQMARGSAG